MKRKAFKQFVCSVAVSMMLAAAPEMPKIIPSAVVTAEAKSETSVKAAVSVADQTASPEFNYKDVYLTKGGTQKLFLRNVKKGTKVEWNCSTKVKITVDKLDSRFCEVRGLVPGAARVYATVNGKRIYSTVTIFEKIENTTVRINKVSSPKYNKVTINWNKLDGVTSYWIYYRKPGGKWRLVSKVGSQSRTYTHTASQKNPVTVGQKYQYTVVGYNKYTRKFSKYHVNGWGVMTQPVRSKVCEIGLTGDNKVVRVNWEYAEGCYYYRLYRNSGSGWTYLGMIPKTSRTYYDKSPVYGKTNRYAVVPYYGSLGNYTYEKTGVGIYVPKPVVKVSGVSLNRSNLKLTSKGEQFTLKASVRPANATNAKVTYSSSDTSVVTVNSAGAVTAHKEGSATVTVKTVDGNYRASCRVVVKYPDPDVVHVTYIYLDRRNLTIGGKNKTQRLSATLLPANADNKKVVWSSSNPSVARVDSQGNVTSVANGTCVITARSADSGKISRCTVKVINAQTKYTYSFDSEFDAKDFYQDNIVSLEGGFSLSILVKTQNPNKKDIRVVLSNDCLWVGPIFNSSKGSGYTIGLDANKKGDCNIRIYCENVLMFNETCRVTSNNVSWLKFEAWKKKVISDMGSSWTGVNALQKVINFGQYILDHYDYSASAEDSYHITGKGNCYASASTLYLIADALGLEAEVVNPSWWAKKNPGHVVCKVTYAGIDYYIEAGYSGTAPRGTVGVIKE